MWILMQKIEVDIYTGFLIRSATKFTFMIVNHDLIFFFFFFFGLFINNFGFKMWERLLQRDVYYEQYCIHIHAYKQ